MTRGQPPGRRAAAAAALVAGTVAAAGCGAAAPTTDRAVSDRGHRPATGAPGQRPATIPNAPAGRLLVEFKRAVGADPLASQLTVDTTGRATAIITLGGISGEKKHTFTLSPAQLRRLRRLVEGTQLRDTACCQSRTYIYWVMHHGHAWRLQQGAIPRAMRPLIDDLDALTDAHTEF